MTGDRPFLPSEARDAFDEPGDYLLPIVLPKPGLLMGEHLAVLVLETTEGQRVGVPMGMQMVSDLRELLGEAPRMMQPTDSNSVH